MKTLTLLMLSVTMIVGCTQSPPIQRHEACQEQADAWCRGAGFPGSPGCNVAYLHNCEPDGPMGSPIDASTHNACMDEIAGNPMPTTVPAACRASW